VPKHTQSSSESVQFICMLCSIWAFNTSAVKFIVGAHLLCPLASRDLFCAGQGITWSCPYSHIANRGTQQPAFSFVCPCRVFCVGVMGRRGVECGAFFVLGCGAFPFFLDRFDLGVWHSVERNVPKPKAFLTHSQCVNLTS
jgi:hypothetical protein